MVLRLRHRTVAEVEVEPQQLDKTGAALMEAVEATACPALFPERQQSMQEEVDRHPTITLPEVAALEAAEAERTLADQHQQQAPSTPEAAEAALQTTETVRQVVQV